MFGQTRGGYFSQLTEKKVRRSHHFDDPQNLPNRSLQPNPDRKPRDTEKAFQQSGLRSNPNVKLAALGDFTFDKLAGAGDPAYLAASLEVILSQAIKDQAAALAYDPVKIYHWVRNTIQWQPT